MPTLEYHQSYTPRKYPRALLPRHGWYIDGATRKLLVLTTSRAVGRLPV